MFNLKLRDFLKGLLLAVIVPVLTVVQQSLDAGVLTINGKQLIIVALSAMVAYLLKNYFTDDLKQAEKIIKQETNKMTNQFIKDTVTGQWLQYQTGTDNIIWVNTVGEAFAFQTQAALDAQLNTLNAIHPDRYIGAGGIGLPK